MATVNVGPVTVHTWPEALKAVSDEELAAELLRRIAGLDPTHPQHEATPRRYVSALKELTTPLGYKFTTFDTMYDEMIIERNIPFVSLCQHHVLPFAGVAHIGYIPNIKMAGLSKLARCVKAHAAQLQVQEELTAEIAHDLREKLEPKGVAVVLEAEHMCMTIRGVQAPGTTTYTACMQGVFADHTRTAKAEFLSRINNS
jgi:GTP cyclohydrolase I